MTFRANINTKWNKSNSFFDLNQPNNVTGHPDLELLFFSGTVTSDVTFKNTFGINDKLCNSYYKEIEQYNTFQIVPMILRPKSKKWIELKNKIPF